MHKILIKKFTKIKKISDNILYWKQSSVIERVDCLHKKLYSKLFDLEF